MKRKQVFALLAALSSAAVLGIGCDMDRDAGVPGTTTERTAGQKVDDRQLQDRVADALEENAAYKFPDVEVNAYAGKVQLSGFVVTQEQKDRAEHIAEAVAGEANVENKISVKR